MQKAHGYKFGPFQLDLENRQLLREGDPVPLAPKTFDMLLALIGSSGRVIEKDELMRMVWPDTYVEGINLLVHISALRKALGESATEPKYIATVPKRGYRFLASVSEGEGDEAVRTDGSAVVDRIPIGEEDESDESRESAFRKKTDDSLASSMHQPLNRKAVAVLALLGCFLMIGYWVVVKLSGPGPKPGNRSIAVLPFKVLTSEEEYLGIGLTDALITRLSNIRSLVVRPTSSVLKYSAADQDPLIAGRELKVETVLDGKIQRSSDRIRVTVQMLRVSDGVPVWAETIDEDFTNIFAVQDSISRKVTGALAMKLSGEDKTALTRHYTENNEVYQTYLKGRYFWSKRTTEELKKAIEAFNRTIEMEPGYAPGYAGLADCYSLLARSSAQANELFERAKESASKALALDDHLAEAHTSMGLILSSHDWDWSGGEKEFKRAIELNPNYSAAHHWYGMLLTMMGRFDEAVSELEQAQTIDPFSIVLNTNLGQTFYFARHYDKAIEQYQKTLELDTGRVFTPAILREMGRVYEQKNMPEEALSKFQKSLEQSPHSPTTMASLVRAYSASGKISEAKKSLDRLIESSKKYEVSPFDMAIAYNGLEQADRAIEFLEKAYREKSFRLTWIKVDPRFDNLHSNTRFADLLRRMRLE